MPAWAIRCTYGEGALEKRDAALAAHEAYLDAHSREIYFAGPMFADDGATRTGLWLLIEATDRAGAEAFIAEEGFNRAGMFGAIEIRRFVDSAPRPRRQVDIAADPARQMFICELAEGPDAETLGLVDDDGGPSRKSAARIVLHGLSTTDDGLRPLGAISIVEVENRAALDRLFAPALRAPTISVDRWRFGKSVV